MGRGGWRGDGEDARAAGCIAAGGREQRDRSMEREVVHIEMKEAKVMGETRKWGATVL